ncbi:hypothetical protein ABVB72_18550 [Rhizobium nepotum]|uniref:hypothetical protein n=1 Tax=Rhizobium nepotum TaxID=1035271 RepID=UPI00336ACB45
MVSKQSVALPISDLKTREFFPDFVSFNTISPQKFVRDLVKHQSLAANHRRMGFFSDMGLKTVLPFSSNPCSSTA